MHAKLTNADQSDLVAAADRAVDLLRDELVGFLQSLVRSPSLPGAEQAAQLIMADKYRSLQLVTDVLTSVRENLETHPAFFDDGVPFDSRLNIIGRWRGKGKGRSLILNGHIDVVPPGDLAQWAHSPWNADVVGDRLYGRGACDMKAGLTAAAFAVQALQSAGFQPKGDVLLESVIGEESGGIGTLTTIVHGYRADACVIIEPTSLTLVPVHSGALTFRITIHGRAAHACMKPSGVSAIEEFMPILARLQRLNVERHQQWSHPLFADQSNIAPISVGTVHAGDWHSTVPNLLVAEGRFGVFPGESVGDARQLLADTLRTEAERHPWLVEHPPMLEWFEGQFESGETAVTSPIVGVVEQAHRSVTGSPLAHRGITGGTDLRLFTRHAGIPTILYGPGTELVAHTTYESVSIEEVITCTKALARTIVAWCSE